MAKRMIVAPQASRSLQANTLEEKAVEQSHLDAIETNAHKKALARHEMRKELITISDKVASHNYYTRNWKFPEADKVFPGDWEWDKRVVTKYYPMAEGGALLVDEPISDWDVNRAWEKHKVLRKLGYRHIVIEKDTTVDQCLEQLGEL